MPFNLFRNRHKAESPLEIKSAVEKESRAQKEISAVKEEGDSQKEGWRKQANSKAECKHCGKSALFRYVATYDEAGDEEMSLMDCLNCGFKYAYFDKAEKADKASDGDFAWWFALMVLMLVTILVIKGNSQDSLINDSSGVVREMPVRNINRSAGEPDGGVYPVLNDPETPFLVGG